MLTHPMAGGSRRMITIRLLVVSVVAAAVAMLGGRPALASCAELPDLESAFAEADVVFIGVVVELSNADRTAVMEVEQVWKGPQLPGEVTVLGGPDDPGLFTSVDRTFERGTYVVFPVNSTPPFEDNACTLTQPTTTALDVINPFAAEPPEDPTAAEPVPTTSGAGASPAGAAGGGGVAVESGATEDGAIQPWAVGAGLGVTLLVVGLLALRRRPWPRS